VKSHGSPGQAPNFPYLFLCNSAADCSISLIIIIVIIIIIINHEFHGDTSLETKLHGLRFGAELDQVTADELQTFKVTGFKVKVTA